MGMVKAAAADAVLTALWVFSLPLIGLTSNILGIDRHPPFSLQSLLGTIALIATFFYTFTLLSSALGGASFNPATTLCLLAAGLKKAPRPLINLAVLFPAQAAGAVLGAMGILQVMPPEQQHRLKGPVLKVGMLGGAATEAALTFGVSMNLMVVVSKGPNPLVAKVWLLATGTLCAVMIGSGLTGPSMNPANAFGWAYVKDWHHSWELYCVYWAGPFVGAVLAGRLFAYLFATAPVKAKKA